MTERMHCVPRFSWSQGVEHQFTNSACKDAKSSAKLGLSLLLSSEPKSFKSFELDQPVSQASRGNDWELPKLRDNYFRLGEDHPDKESVIYMRLDRSSGVVKALRRYYQPGNKIEIWISISLKYNGYEFCKRRIPFKSNANLDVKFRARYNQENFREFLNNLSSKIQVLVETETENSKVVLESEEIFYRSLNYTIASLSICKVTDIATDPKSVHHVNCHVFLDRSPSLCGLGSSNNSGNLCIECTEGSYLMTIFNEVKHSSGTVDLARPEMTATSMEMDPIDTDDLEDDYEWLEPTELIVKKAGTKDVEMETEDNPLSILELVLTESGKEIEKSSSNLGTEAFVKSVGRRRLKADKTLRKVMTPEPIQRKHQGYPLERFLMQKVERMRHKLLALQVEIAEKEQSGSISQSESLAEAKVPSSTIDQQSPPITMVLLKNDGSTAIVPSVSPNPVEIEKLMAMTSADAGTKGQGKPFECPVEGSNHRYKNKSSVSSHKQKLVLPQSNAQ